MVVDKARRLASIKLKYPRFANPSHGDEFMDVELSTACILNPDATHVFSQQVHSSAGDSARANFTEMPRLASRAANCPA
jgi:hypothetical protein